MPLMGSSSFWAITAVIFSALGYPQWGGDLSLAFNVIGLSLLLSLAGKTCKRASLPYLQWAVSWFLVHFLWLSWMGQSPLIGPLGILFASFLAMLFSLFTLPWLFLYRRSLSLELRKNLWGGIAIDTSLCLLWPLTESARMFIFVGYPWAQLAWSLTPLQSTRSLLPWIGVHGASALCVALALGLNIWIEKPRLRESRKEKNPSKKVHPQLSWKSKAFTTAFLLLFTFSFSVALFSCYQVWQLPDQSLFEKESRQGWHIQSLSKESLRLKESGQPYVVAVMHTDWEATLQPFTVEQLERRWEALIETLLPYRGMLDLVVFPEVVVPCGFEECIYGEEDSNGIRASLLAKVLNSYLIIGLEDDRSSQESVQNSLFVFDKEGALLHHYGKQKLLPLAEKIPSFKSHYLNTFVREVLKSRGIYESLATGTTKPRVRLFGEQGPVAHLSICFEETFPSLALESKRMGADLIISSSHDGWFSETILPFMHFWQARLVSAVSSLPVLRSTHQGLSGAISLDRTGGEVVKSKTAASDPPKKGVQLLFFSLSKTHQTI